MGQSRLTRSFAVVSVCVILSLTACGSADSATTSDSASTTGGSSIAAPPADATPSVSASVEADVPAYDQLKIDGWVIKTFPYPKGSKLNDFEQPTSPTDDDITIKFSTTDSDAVMEFYQKVLPSLGYEASFIPGIGVNFTGNGVQGDVIDNKATIDIVISKG